MMQVSSGMISALNRLTSLPRHAVACLDSHPIAVCTERVLDDYVGPFAVGGKLHPQAALPGEPSGIAFAKSATRSRDLRQAIGRSWARRAAILPRPFEAQVERPSQHQAASLKLESEVAQGARTCGHVGS